MPKAAINNFRILAIGLLTLALDQITKWIVVQRIPGPAHGSDAPIVVIDGFFELVHYGNTGAAWSMFSGNNFWLAIFSMVALVFLWVCRRQFGVETTLGQVALGLMLGGVTGNLIDGWCIITWWTFCSFISRSVFRPSTWLTAASVSVWG